MRKIVLFLSVVAISVACCAQSGPGPEILVLGTYHMANPGHDMFNMQADDVLSAKRQQEIAQLIEVLKKFHPTKIAVEADVSSKRTAQEYADYLAGKYTLTRNETNQIGYRLAKELGHKAVYPVDVDGDFPILRVINYAKANGSAEKFDAIMAKWGAQAKAQYDVLRSHTVLETLEYMNADARAEENMASYLEIVRYGEPYEYAGGDLLAAYYQRNIRIYTNIVKLIDSANDRILVIYGSGHLPWLRHDIANDATVRLRKLADLSERQ